MRRLAQVAALALALAACGKVGPPVAPEQRLPRPVTGLHGVVEEGGIELSWTNPTRRVDNTRLRDLTLARVFRAEDTSAGEPRAAIFVRGRIPGYTEVATVRLDQPPSAPVDSDAPVVQGNAVRMIDRRGLAYGRRYTYVVVVEDSQGRASAPSERLTIAFIAPPEPPQGLTAAEGERQVRLTWNPPARLVDGTAPGPLTYEVLRAPDPTAPLQVVTPSPIEATQFTDSNLENDHTYYYAVRALRREGTTVARSRPTERVAATPVKMTPPAPPTDLVATPSGNTVRLSWKPSPDADVATYVIYRAAGSGPFERVGSVNAPRTTFVDQGLRRETYRYVVTAQDSSSRANESRRSNEARVTLP